jgi:hypothetical protein
VRLKKGLDKGRDMYYEYECEEKKKEEDKRERGFHVGGEGGRSRA